LNGPIEAGVEAADASTGAADGEVAVLRAEVGALRAEAAELRAAEGLSRRRGLPRIPAVFPPIGREGRP